MTKVRVRIIVLVRICLGLQRRGRIITFQLKSSINSPLRKKPKHPEKTNQAWTSSKWATQWPSVRLLVINISQPPKRKLKSLLSSRLRKQWRILRFKPKFNKRQRNKLTNKSQQKLITRLVKRWPRTNGARRYLNLRKNLLIKMTQVKATIVTIWA